MSLAARVIPMLLAALAPVAEAQLGEGRRWTSSINDLSFTIPPGWSQDTTDIPAGVDIFRKAPSAPGRSDDSMCFLRKRQLPVPANGPDGKPLTQEKVNRDSAPYPVGVWLTALEKSLGQDKLTSIESLPTLLVDGKATVTVIATNDRGLRVYVASGMIMSPSAGYSFDCMFPTRAAPLQEPAGFRENVIAEFLAIVKSADTD